MKALTKILHRKIKSRTKKPLFTIHYSLFTIFLLALPLHAQTYDLSALTSALHENNPDIRAAEEEYKRSQLDYKDALAGFGPKIDLQLSGTYMLNPPVGSLSVNVDDIIDAVQWPNGVNPSKTGQYIKVFDGMESTYYSFGLSLEQPVFTWGKLINAARLYKEISKIQEIKLDSTKQQLKTELETRIVSLGYLYKINQILKEEKTYADEMVKFSEDAEKNGMLLHQDVIEARIQAKELDIAEQGVNEQINTQLIELQRLTGIQDLTFGQIDYAFDENAIAITKNPAREEKNVSDKPKRNKKGGDSENTTIETEKITFSQIYSADEKTRADFLETALSGNQPTIKMVTQAKVVNDMATRIAKDSVYWKPDIGFQASASYAGSRFPFIEKNWNRKDDYTINLSLGIKTTVWDGGKKLNNVARSKSNVESAQINSDAARATIRKTLQEQFNTTDVCTMKIEYQDLKIETAESKIKQQETLFDSGYGSQTDLLSAKIDKCNEQIQKTQAELQRAVAGLTIKFLVNVD